MGYVAAAKLVNAAQERAGFSSPVGVYMEAKAADLLGYDVQAAGVRFKFGESGDLLQEVSTEGFTVLLPVFAGDLSGVYRAAELPDELFNYRSYRDLRGILPAQHIDFMDELQELYDERIFSLNLLSKKHVFGIKKLMQAGFPVIIDESPVWGDQESPLNIIAAGMQVVREAYDDDNVAAGEALIRSGKRDVEFWGAVESAVRAVRDLPTNTVAAAAKFGAVNIVPIALLLAAGIGVLLLKDKIAGLKFSTIKQS